MSKAHHGLLHIAGCLLPLLAVFLLPVFGINNGAVITLFFILMLVCHVLMMAGYSKHHHSSSDHLDSTKH